MTKNNSQIRNFIKIIFQEGPYCNYLISEEKFLFNKICVNNQYSAKLHFQNSSSVLATIHSSVISQTGNVFSVSETPVSIEGYSHNFITVSFTPESTGVSQTKLFRAT